MKRAGLRRMTIVISVCAVVGALAGIAGSAAAPSQKSAAAAKKKAQAKAKAKKQAQRRVFRGGPGGIGFGPGGPALHAEAVVPKADGTGFDTIVTDAGTLLSVDGNTVHLKQATDKATYKDDAAIDVGTSPQVIRNHEQAKLSDLKAGDHVRVIKGPQETVVIAEDDAWLQQERKHFGRGWHGREHGPDGDRPGAPGGPPNQNGSLPGAPAGTSSS